MNPAQYLVRFDDVSPTMNWPVWEKIEQLLLGLNIKPIVAVVPNNQDPELFVRPPREDFWDRVRFWRNCGWSIGLHGFEHRYETCSAGLIGINPYSEFAGLSEPIQKEKLKTALNIFYANDIVPDLWVAPAHSFDRTTVKLLIENGIRIISDGFYWRPVLRMNAIWVPQQMWRLRRLSGGTWTVCYHVNHFSEKDLTCLNFSFRKFRNRINGMKNLLAQCPPRTETRSDKLFNWCWMKAIRLKRRILR